MFGFHSSLLLLSLKYSVSIPMSISSNITYIYTFIAEDMHLIAYVQYNIEKEKNAICGMVLDITKKRTQVSQKMILTLFHASRKHVGDNNQDYIIL